MNNSFFLFLYWVCVWRKKIPTLKCTIFIEINIYSFHLHLSHWARRGQHKLRFPPWLPVSSWVTQSPWPSTSFCILSVNKPFDVLSWVFFFFFKYTLNLSSALLSHVPRLSAECYACIHVQQRELLFLNRPIEVLHRCSWCVQAS